MPSFDIVSEVDMHELTNAVDQANREVTTRYDFKGADAVFTLKEETIVLEAQSDFQVQQMVEILKLKLAKRSIDLAHMQYGEMELSNNRAKQVVTVQQGISKEFGKKLTKQIKDSKIKVQASIQGEEVRVTGKKRDDLQAVMNLLREADTELPLSFQNFRD